MPPITTRGPAAGVAPGLAHTGSRAMPTGQAAAALLDGDLDTSPPLLKVWGKIDPATPEWEVY